MSSSRGSPKTWTTNNSQRAGYKPSLENHTIRKAPKSGPESGRIKKLTDNRQLAKRVAEAERQLMSQTKDSIKTDAQTQGNIPLQMANKSMIAPGAWDTPKFSLRQPHELRRFIRTMEDMWRDASVISDSGKKELIGKYADQESEEEWMALEVYNSQTWEEFKKELLLNYPEAAAAERGTPARLRQLCNETQGICLGDLMTLYTFQRLFLAEAQKLTKPPTAMSNRELVELFIGSLSETMAASVLQLLGNKRPDSTDGWKEPIKRQPEDQYDIDKVCKAAVQVSESSQGMFNLMNKPSVKSASKWKVDKAELANKSLDLWFTELEKLIKTLFIQG